MIWSKPLLWLAGCVVAVLVTTIGALWFQNSRVETKLDAAYALAERKRVAAVDAAIGHMKGQMITQARRDAVTRKALDEAESKSKALAADVAASIAGADRLRDAATRAAGHCARAAYPAATGSSAPASDAGLLLADVLGRMDARGRELAELADRRGIAGALCEAERDALTTP